MKFNTIPEISKDLKKGRMVIIVDDEGRENEGDLVIAAEYATPQAINFIITHAKGLVCMPMEGSRLDELGLHPMHEENQDTFKTAWAISVDAKKNTTTGISAHDRSVTVKALINPGTMSADLARPGHVFPLRAKDGGTLTRAGHTEACVDLMKLAGLYPAGVICEIINNDGTMARQKDLVKFAKKHKLKIGTIAELINYRRRSEKLVTCIANSQIPTDYGVFKLYLYESSIDRYQHMALVKGDVKGKKDVLVRVHSECLTGDIFGSRRCDCGDQLKRTLRLIGEKNRGVLLYMRQEGRGIGLANKIKAYALQDKGFDTVEANEQLGFKPDLRDYGIGAQILADLGLKTIQLITNNPRKIVGLSGYGLEVVKRVPMEVQPNCANVRYLETKKKKLGHKLKRSLAAYTVV
ncbi:MAG: bifunctional 3,4-dihydroxy-2-butanone-4-phosphate synthase/GTP cyclohydrolase II [Candidatus Omnitrophota bacterium]|nr:bifunctional 3,4-dihydroxy-2-butanone-4-phosphate synthase/GTP cyclohydrolase II [Candidatus Omnitrophota bacterium]